MVENHKVQFGGCRERLNAVKTNSKLLRQTQDSPYMIVRSLIQQESSLFTNEMEQ